MMQPYFFPYLGYFSLIRHTDIWVVFDSAQFRRHSWIERNRVLHPLEGWLYIQVPLVKHPRSTPIMDVKIRTEEPWRERLLAQLVHYRKVAPYYAQVISLIRDALDINLERIAALDVHVLEKCCRYLDIPFKYTVFSSSSISGIKANSPDEWALETAKAFGATEYINPPNGRALFDNAKYESAGVRLTFLEPRMSQYDQRRERFESHLSIIDAMMFNEPTAIRGMLDKVDLVSGSASKSLVEAESWHESDLPMEHRSRGSFKVSWLPKRSGPLEILGSAPVRTRRN
jgi:hypothetical protein